MIKQELKFRKQLNQKQLDILALLYKFRFGTTELLAESLNMKDKSFIFRRLATLEEQDYIARHYDSSYKLHGQLAAYYLLPKGLRTLQTFRQPESLDDKTIKNSYKDKNASRQFICNSLAIYRLHNRLTVQYDKLQFFTKRELASYEYFPKPLPDAFLSLDIGKETRRFFLELIDISMPSFAIDKRLRQYIAYFDGDEWDATGLPFPTILIVCETESLEKRVQKQTVRALHKAEVDMLFYTTSLNLAASTGSTWSNPVESEERVELGATSVNP
jgi:hypothetical protein